VALHGNMEHKTRNTKRNINHMSWKIKQTNYLKSKEWKSLNKTLTHFFKHTCWVCNIIDKRCSTKHKSISAQANETIKNTVCLCPECFRAVNKMMWEEEEFLVRLNDLKRIMNKNGYNRLLTYDMIRSFKADLLETEIEEYKQTKNAELRDKLIKKVLSLPI